MNYSTFFATTRDEVSDLARGDIVNESRDAERKSSESLPPPFVVEEDGDNAQAVMDEPQQHQHVRRPLQDGEVSVLSTLTQLLFNVDGYCKTPFCSDGDYLPPSCFYTAPSYHQQDRNVPRTYPYHYDNSNDHPARTHHPWKRKAGTPLGESEQEVHDNGDNNHNNNMPPFDDGQDLRTSYSGSASSSSGKRPYALPTTPTTPRQVMPRRPLAFAVGYGDELKDEQGRRVIITPRRKQPLSPLFPGSGSVGSVSSGTSSQHAKCTCDPRQPRLPSSFGRSTNMDAPDSPHQTTAAPLCKACSRRVQNQSLEVPASTSLVGFLSPALDPSSSRS